MLKQVASLIIASIIILFLSPYIAKGFGWLDYFYTWLYHLSGTIFSNNDIGSLLQKLVALLLIPLVCAGLPAGIYYMIYRKTMPYLIQLIWVIWIIVAVLTIK